SMVASQCAARSQLRVVDLLVYIERPVHGWQRVFEAARAIEEHGTLVTANATVCEALLVRRVRSASFRAHQEAFPSCNFVYSSREGVVAHRDSEATAFAYGTQDQKIADRLRTPDPARNSVRILEARRVLRARLERSHHRGAALRLHGDHAGALGADEPDRF